MRSGWSARRRPRPPRAYALARTRTGVVYVVEEGTGTIRRILPSGRSSVLRLQAPRTTMGALARRPVPQQPFDLLPVAGGRFVVTDLPANAVYELDPACRTGRQLARVNQARELERLKDGRILVTSRARVLSLNPRTGKTSLYATARNYLLGIALAPDGWLYGSENVPGSDRRRSSGSAAARARRWRSCTACTGSSTHPPA